MTMSLTDVRALADAIRAEIAKAIVGQDGMVDMLLVALLSEGHVLMEGPPGTAKTFLANAFSGASSSRLICCRAIFWARTCSTSRPASSPSPAGRSSATCCSRTRSTAPRPRPRPHCSKRCRNAA